MIAGMESPKLAAVEALLGPHLTEAQARGIVRLGKEAVIFALLKQAQMLATQSNGTAPSTPSGMTPVYEKPTTGKRQRRRGQKKGHRGHRRPKPVRIDRSEVHTLEQCPDCQSPVTLCRTPRTRLIEDIPENIQPVVTQHTIHRYWCSQCQKTVEPVVTDALPKAQIG